MQQLNAQQNIHTTTKAVKMTNIPDPCSILMCETKKNTSTHTQHIEINDVCGIQSIFNQYLFGVDENGCNKYAWK